jgi:hypothetical protein
VSKRERRIVVAICLLADTAPPGSEPVRYRDALPGGRSPLEVLPMRSWVVVFWMVAALATGALLALLGFALAVVYFSECTCLVGTPR